MSTSSVHVYESPEAVAHAAAERFVALATRATLANGKFVVALSGGSTPRRMYELLASGAYRCRVKWPKVHVFFGDERPVAPTDAQSNFRLAQDALLSKVYAASVTRIHGEGDPTANAKAYEEKLRAMFPDQPWPAFDLVLLGMGEDGHTASLFPGTRALDERHAWFVCNKVDKLRSVRLTLTPGAIQSAHHVLMTVCGAPKASRLADVLEGPRDVRRLPAQLVLPAPGRVEWMVDKDAASLLTTPPPITKGTGVSSGATPAMASRVAVR